MSFGQRFNGKNIYLHSFNEYIFLILLNSYNAMYICDCDFLGRVMQAQLYYNICIYSAFDYY